MEPTSVRTPNVVRDYLDVTTRVGSECLGSSMPKRLYGGGLGICVQVAGGSTWPKADFP